MCLHASSKDLHRQFVTLNTLPDWPHSLGRTLLDARDQGAPGQNTALIRCKNGERVAASKEILAARADFFKDKGEGALELGWEESSGKVVDTLVTFLYTDVAELRWLRIEELVPTPRPIAPI